MMTSNGVLLSRYFTCLVLVYSVSAWGQSTTRELSAVYTSVPINVDGVLDEPVWEESMVADAFVQTEPDQGSRSMFPTSVRVLYNEEYLYFGAILTDSLGGDRVQSLRRDFDPADGDVFGIVLDLFDDRRHCVSLQVNPPGAQRDIQVFDDEYVDEDFEIVWETRAQVFTGGWSVEIAVPWKSLRYPSGMTRCGINFFRLARRANEMSAWAPFPRSYSPFRLEFAGTLQNLRAPSPGINVRVIPYTTARTQDQYLNDGFSGASPGVDLRWVSSPNTTVDITYNSDFAQADNDRQFVNLNRFSLSLPERRPFFSENAGLFRIGSTDWIQPFYSRRIGLTDVGDPLPVLGGLRFIKLGGDSQVGALYARTEASQSSSATDFFLGRVNFNPGGESRFGGLLTARVDHDSVRTKNFVAAVDGFTRFSSSLSWQGMLSGSLTEGHSGKPSTSYGVSANSSLRFRDDDINVYWNSVLISPNYEAGLGFISWDDLLANEIGTDLFLRPSWKPSSIRDFEPALYCHVYQNASDLSVKELQLTIWPLYILFNNGAILSSKAISSWVQLNEAFAPVAGVAIPPGKYQHTQYELRYTTDPSTALAGGIYVATGGYYRGTLRSFTPTVTVRPIPNIAVSVEWERNWINNADGKGSRATAEILNSEALLSLNPTTHFTVSYQYDRSARLSRTQLRFAWEYRSLSYLYFILGFENRQTISLAKVTYAAQF